MTWQADKIRVEDDGLCCPDVGRWAEEKYRLLCLYDELFSTGMKNKWEKRVYIDLYAAAGFCRVRGTQTILMGSPLLALSVPDRFDKYIFCEGKPELLGALRTRAERIAPHSDIAFINGNCDDRVNEILAAVPTASPGNRVLSLCVIDPFDFGLKFATIQRLSVVFIDFVVLLAIGMDANRNYDHYVDGNSTKIDDALGNTDWRERWKDGGKRRSDFRRFLAGEFSRSMESIGFLGQPISKMKLVRSDEKNLPLYYLALFSKHTTAQRFWDNVLKYGTDQTSFPWE